MNFLHTFHPSPALLQLGSITIYWYSFFIVLSIFLGIFVATRFARHYGFKNDDVYDLAFYLVIFGILGARVYAVLLFPKYYFDNPLEIVQVWKGGLAIHGAIIACIITLFIYCKKKKQDFSLWADILVVVLALGQAIGRWGNYFNQELFGKPTNLAWGIPIDPINRIAGYNSFEYFHPVFLYESILNLIVFIILLTIHIYRIKNSPYLTPHPNPLPASPARFVGALARRADWPTGEREKVEGIFSVFNGEVVKNEKFQVSSFKFQAGNIASLYLIFYSLIRIAMEQFRIDDTPIIFGIRFPIIISSVIFFVALFYFFRRQKISEKPKNI